MGHFAALQLDYNNTILQYGCVLSGILVLEATTPTMLRQGDWVMIPPYPGPQVQPNVNIELGNSNRYQLYHLKEDIGEQHDRVMELPDKLQDMIEAYIELRHKNHPGNLPNQ